MLLYMFIDKNHNFHTVAVDAGAATESHFRLVDGERHTVAGGREREGGYWTKEPGMQS